MNLTSSIQNSFHARLLAETLSLRRSSQDAAKLYQPLSQSTMDLNPHQVEASIFAFKSPLSRGAILADEVGLGKTIEAGLIISQLLAEGKRHILILCPATIRGQWQEELLEKFGVTSIVVHGKTLREEFAPLRKPGVYILSIPFAYRKVEELRTIPWDLIVIDEAHRLRNLRGRHHLTLKEAFARHPKLLLTATPLQNNLIELFALTSFVDPKLLGTDYSFREKFMEDGRGLQIVNEVELKARIQTLITRTLRRQVQEYIRFTDRRSMVQDFTPTFEEQELYQKVSAYLQRPGLAAIEQNQRTLMILVYRKLLASSSFAIAPTLKRLAEHLEARLASSPTENQTAVLDEETDAFLEEREELSDELSLAETKTMFDDEQIRMEIAELKDYYNLANRIQSNAKGEALLVALGRIREEAQRRHWPNKVVIFTESRRTQRYLKDLLEAKGYKEQITLFSGSSGDLETRKALIKEFETKTRIFLTTEAGAEGLNLQFANVVVNYDLPWNPQRIEQRIGRCHRYGQKYDVAVINFVNRSNAADQRLYELLDQKLKLFQGIFGASDEVLGVVESGIDFERRVLEIYQSCRTEEEINAAFQKLQDQLEEKIQTTLAETRSKLLENFDDEVREKFRLRDASLRSEMTEVERQLQNLVRVYMGDHLVPVGDGTIFQIRSLPPALALKTGSLTVGSHICFTRASDETLNGLTRLHLGHEAVQIILLEMKQSPAPISSIRLLYTKGNHRIALLEPYKDKQGYWFLYRLTLEGLEVEDHLVSSVLVREGNELVPLFHETARHFHRLTIEEVGQSESPSPDKLKMAQGVFQESQSQLAEVFYARNCDYYEAERDKLDLFMEECLMQIEDELASVKAQWQEAKKRKNQAITAEERLAIREEIDRLETEYRRKMLKSQAENLRQMEEKKKRLKELETQLATRTQYELVGIASWELI